MQVQHLIQKATMNNKPVILSITWFIQIVTIQAVRMFYTLNIIFSMTLMVMESMKELEYAPLVMDCMC